MIIKELSRNNDFLPLEQQRSSINNNQRIEDTTFAGTLKSLINDTNNLQIESSQLTESMIKGEPVDIHDVMIAAQKSKTAFQLLMELRNKGLDLYREVLRMQI